MNEIARLRKLSSYGARLSRRKPRQASVRESALEYDFQFDNSDADQAVTIRDATLHLEMPNSMLVNELANSIESPLVSFLPGD